MRVEISISHDNISNDVDTPDIMILIRYPNFSHSIPRTLPPIFFVFLDLGSGSSCPLRDPVRSSRWPRCTE